MIPKSIANDPRVREVEDGDSTGSDRRWLVYLKPGWRYPSGAHVSGFDTVTEFRATRIEREPGVKTVAEQWGCK